MVAIIDLCCFAILFCWHLWLEERDRWSIEVELSGNSCLLSRWLVSQLFDIFICLNIHMHSSWYWFWCWDVSIWVFWDNSLRSPITRLESSSFHGLLSLFHDHRVVVGSCWDNHSCIRVSTMDTFIIHDVLWIVLPIIRQKISLNVPGVTLLRRVL